MKTYKNTYFVKRNYECTNIVFAQTEGTMPAEWVECDEAEIAALKCDQLWKEAGVRYFGYL
jgi:hypothetical protein